MLNRNALIKQSLKSKNPISQSIVNISQYYEPEPQSPNMSVQQRPAFLPSIQILSVSGVAPQEDKYHYPNQNQESMVLSRIQNNGNRSQIEKIIQIEEQQKEIQKVAQELIFLRHVVKRLKISLGAIVQEGDMDFIEAAGVDYKGPVGDEQQQNNFGQSQNQLATLRLSSSLSNCKITPQYKEWIIQYLSKLMSDVQQIKGMFSQKKNNSIDLQSKSSHNNLNQRSSYNPQNKQSTKSAHNKLTQQSYLQLIEYQIKCRLIETVLKLCRSKNILTQHQAKKFIKEITITPINNITLNLSTHKLSTLIEKINTINNFNNNNNQNNNNHSIQQLFYKWKTIHDQLEIINIQEIQRFYLQKKKAQKQNYHNNDNGILIIGGSGSGKTTLWLAMAGEKMIKKKIKSKNGEIENYQAADQEVANKYKTSPFATSCTRQPAKLQAPKRYTFPQQLCLIDTAGFQQSRTGQIDIMNTLYTYQTIQEMKKLRIIIVVSEKNIGQREQQLIKFAKYVGRYFRDYEQVRESILFVLTKFQSIKRLRVACDNVLKHVQIDRESNQYKFLKHLQQSIVYKQCIEFKPTEQKIIFQAQYHIDPIQLDSKLKKIYKALLKKFPFHHQYQNDYINLQYSKQTRDKLISKRCYLQNMIRRLYKEGNNCYRFYLQQLLFLQSKINKLDIINHGYQSPRDNIRQNYQGGESLEYSIIQFIEQINAQLIQKFNFLLQDYLKSCDTQILHKILQIRDKCQRIYCQQNTFQGMNNQGDQMIDIDDDEYHYVFREIIESINGLKLEIQRIVEERVKQWSKVMKYKAKWCHDVGNKKWLCAVVNFTKMYFAKYESLQQKDELSNIKQHQQQKTQNIQNMPQKCQKLESSPQQIALIKTLTKTQQKFRTQLTQQLNLINQQITNFFIRQQQQSTEQQIDEMFVKQTVNQMKQAINGFKRLVFFEYLQKEECRNYQRLSNKDDKVKNIKNKMNNKNIANKSIDNTAQILRNTQKISQQPKSLLLLSPPTDQFIILKNSQFINQIILTILTKQQKEIYANLELIQSFENNDQQITISLWLEVQRFLQKVKMLKQVDDKIGEMAMKVQKKIISRADQMVRGMVHELSQVVKKQHDQQIPIIHSNNVSFINKNNKVTSVVQNRKNKALLPILSSTKLYNYLSKLNELQQFESFSTFLSFEVKFFDMKLKDYRVNLQKQMNKYDEQLGWMKKQVRRGDCDGCMIPFSQPLIYEKLKQIISQCIQLSQQIKVITHYIGQSQSISQLQRVQGMDQYQERSKDVLRFLNSVFYRHSRFLQCEKKSLREEFINSSSNVKISTVSIIDSIGSKNNKNINTQCNNNINTHSNNNFNTLSQLLLDYMILEQTHVHLVKSTHSHYHRTLLQTYQKSYQSLSLNQLPSISEVNSHFNSLVTTQVKVLNQYKQKILQKLISYPLQLMQPILQQIQTQKFHSKLDTNVLSKTVSLFMYFIKLRGLFETIEGLNNQQIVHDYRVIDVQDIMQPLDELDDTLQQLSNLLITVIQITRLKFMQIKQSLVGVLLDQEMCELITTYIKSWHILIQLNIYLQSSPISSLQLLEESLQQLTHYHNITSQLKQFIDRSESIFYRVSKNIDSIELQHLEISQLIDQPQSINEFIKLIKKQAIFLYQQLGFYYDIKNLKSQNNIITSITMNQVVNRLGQFIKKIQDSENVIDSIWEDELKQLQSQNNDPKNSLHKIIKLYEQHITKVSIQKTLQYKFVELKKQQLSDQIKEYLQMPPAQQIVEKGQILCEQLKNYLQFLKSMRLKMVVAINDMDEIKNIQEMQRLYEKQTSRSQAAQRSQTDMTPSQLRENFLSVDYVQSKKENSQRYSVSDVKTSHFGINSNNRVIQRKSAMKKSKQWDEKSNDTGSRQQRHSTNVNMVMDNSFSSLADEWARELHLRQEQQNQEEHSKQYSINNGRRDNNSNNKVSVNNKDSRKNTYYQVKPQLSKSQSEIQFRSSNNIGVNNNEGNISSSMINENSNIYETIVTQSKENEMGQGKKSIKNNSNNYDLSNNNSKNSLSTISRNNNYKYTNNNKSAKTIQVSSSSPYIYPSHSNRVIPNSNNLDQANNNSMMSKQQNYNTISKQQKPTLYQQRSSIVLNNNSNINDNKSTINVADSSKDNNENNNGGGSKFSYSEKYLNNNNNNKKYTINGHNRTDTSQSLNIVTNNNNTNNENNIDSLKVNYSTTNIANMKKSNNMLKYAPPTLLYENTPTSTNLTQKLLKPTTPNTSRTITNPGFLSPFQTKLETKQTVTDTVGKNQVNKMMNKYKIEKKI